MKTLRLLLCAVAVAALQCANPNDGTGSSTESITAMLYNPDNTPAVSAKVCFYRHGDDPRNNHAVDSTYTDNNGNYHKDLDTGTYNILATLDTNATFQDSIIVTEGDTTRPPPDTLRSLGSINGKIELQGTDDPRTVFILFMGSNTFTRPTDLAGNFSATNMAKGRYAVTLITTLDDYDVMDTSFMITAGIDSVIPQPIVLKYTGIPVPKGLRIEYDTMMQIVKLYWNTPTTGRSVQSYTVYRKHSDSASFVSIKAGVTDTSYCDSTGVQDQTYEYRVAVVDTQNTTGVMSAGVEIKIVPAFSISDTITFISPTANDAVIDLHGNLWVAFANGQIGKFDSNHTQVAQWGQQGSAVGQINEPVGIVTDGFNGIYVAERGNRRVQKFDTLGNSIWTIQYDTTTPSLPSLSIAIVNDTLLVNYNEHSIKRYTLAGDSIDAWQFPLYRIGRLIELSGDTLCTNNLGTYGILFINNGAVVLQWDITQMPSGAILDIAYDSKKDYIVAHSTDYPSGKIDVYLFDSNKQLMTIFQTTLFLKRMIYYKNKLYMVSNSDVLIYSF
ncbi:MAG: hypothetical protein JW768_01425 [Chitinispirillaceae bacterium]|nr:hypothetical protein [Chitinispirillaceae bacterium]